MGFTKLDEGLAESSVCRHGLDAVGLWALILSRTRPLKGGRGAMRTSPAFFASITGAPIERVRELFAIFESPDQDSRTPDDDGRKLERFGDGWIVINYSKYREKRDPDERREQVREAVRRHRAVSQGKPSVIQSKPKQKTEAEAEAESVGSVVPTSLSQTREQPSSASALAKVTPVEVEVISWSRAACDDWIARFGGTAPGGQIGKALIPIVKRHGWEFVRKAWCRYLAQAEAQYASPARFSATFGRWSGLAPDPAPLDDATAHNARVLADYMRNRQDGDLGGVVKSMPKLRG